jgi:dephospho-CoA kinase
MVLVGCAVGIVGGIAVGKRSSAASSQRLAASVSLSAYFDDRVARRAITETVARDLPCSRQTFS